MSSKKSRNCESNIQQKRLELNLCSKDLRILIFINNIILPILAKYLNDWCVFAKRLLRGWDDVRTFFKDTKADIQIPAFDLPASA